MALTGSWTKKDLEALEAAIAQGVKSVKYTDKEIEYRSLSEMLRLRDLMRKTLGIASKTTRIYSKFDKGLC